MVTKEAFFFAVAVWMLFLLHLATKLVSDAILGGLPHPRNAGPAACDFKLPRSWKGWFLYASTMAFIVLMFYVVVEAV